MIIHYGPDDNFEAEFAEWEKLRMYPPNYERKPMITLNDHHLIALARARHFVQAGITKNMEPKFIEKIERDLILLSEIHTYVRRQIREPGLPLSPTKVDDDHDGI